MPSYKSREAIYLVILTGLLVVRTYMSIWLADVNGQIVKAIVNKSLPEFLKKVSLGIETNIVDLRTYVVCYSFFYSQLCNGILLEATCLSFQRETD